MNFQPRLLISDKYPCTERARICGHVSDMPSPSPAISYLQPSREIPTGDTRVGVAWDIRAASPCSVRSFVHHDTYGSRGALQLAVRRNHAGFTTLSCLRPNAPASVHANEGRASAHPRRWRGGHHCCARVV